LNLASRVSRDRLRRLNATNRDILQARGVHKTYQLGRVRVEVLRGADIFVRDGEWVTILGASGSGKSTLLHLLGGLDTPDTGKGRITFRDRDLSEMSERQINRYRNQSVGFVFQFYHLLPELTVLENTIVPSLVGISRLMYWRSRPRLRKAGRDLLDSFGLGHRLHHRPRELSGGERQRVAMARALVNRPAVLFADEPTGNLDERTGQEILDLLAAQHQAGLTVVMVTHDHNVAARSDRVVELHDGRVVAGGAASHFVKSVS
jgi:lipoprotein-releasing system ATP-binding protein